MQTNYIAYDYTKSISRIDTILNEQDTSFPEVDKFPSIDKLTFTNGFYVNATALFVDIRDSSKLINAHNRPALAKIYRSFISEVIAIMNGNTNCKFINIDGDCVSGVYETLYTSDIDSAFVDAARISSLIDILNCKLKKKRITEINIGIGMDYGRLLLIKAGFSGSGLNEVAWMGDTLNTASKLCNKANKEHSYEILVSSVIYQNLNDHNKKLLSKIPSQDCYGSNAYFINMNKWVKDNC
ncbi:MAG: family 3 adenylate cyclase [Sulfurovum sp. AS07-7]|nr:MAG: family 3 adenylate cyclase [Sulfurovum sp. AS07-7]